MLTTFRTTIVAALIALGVSVVPASAQAPTMGGITDGQVFFFLQNLPIESAKPLGSLINALLSDTAGHMRMAERSRATRADSDRAAGIVRTMRSSLAPYADVRAAERDGYQLFLPWLDEQVVYHYNNMANAGAARAGFEAAKPTSLLYRKDAKGQKVLVGAMYTAPAGSTLAELDARLPRSVAYWHQHVNFCAMRPSLAVDGVKQSDSTMFARWLKIDTLDECKAAGGIFIPQLFGWMAHVNAFDGESTSAIWGSEGKDQMHRHHGH